MGDKPGPVHGLEPGQRRNEMASRTTDVKGRPVPAHGLDTGMDDLDGPLDQTDLGLEFENSDELLRMLREQQCPSWTVFWMSGI